MRPSIRLFLAVVTCLLPLLAPSMADAKATPFVRQLAPTLRPAVSGQQSILVAARTKPSAVCTATVAVKKVHQTLTKAKATKSGRISWRWQILATSQSGTWRITVRCSKGHRTGQATRRVLVVTSSSSATGSIGDPQSLSVPDGGIAGLGGDDCGPFNSPPVKQCTCLAWEKRRDVYDTSVAHGVPTGGSRMAGYYVWDGGQWLVNAKRGGLATGDQPVKGALVVWGVPNTASYGHVAYVENVASASNIQITECNYDWLGHCRTLWMNPQAKANLQGYIYGGPAGNGPGTTGGGSTGGGSTGGGSTGGGSTGGGPTGGGSTGGGSTGGGLQMLVDGAGQVWARTGIANGGWTQETPVGETKIAAGGTTQMLLDGAGQVWARSGVGNGGWTQETPGGEVAIAAASDGTQMLLDGAGQVWARSGIGNGGWTQESPAGETAIAAGGNIQMLLDGAGQVWAKTGIGNGGWTHETPGGEKAIAAGSDGTQMLLDGAGQVWARSGIGNGGWTQETPGGEVAIAAG